MMRTTLSSLALVVSAAGLCGCIGSYPLVEGTRSLEIEHVLNSRLDVETNNGSVEIAQRDQPDVIIDAVIRARTEERLAATDIAARRLDDGTLEVRAVWPGKRKSNESCSFDISVPDADGVKILTDNGAIKLIGLAGHAEIETDNGSITIEDHRGEVVATSDNGRITVRGSHEPVRAWTDNGRIELLGVATPVRARSDNGRIHIELDDDAPGPVEAETDNGSITLVVGSAFSGSLRATTDNGGVSVDLPTAASVDQPKRTRATVRFSEAGEESTLVTDNGSITVK